MVHFKQICTNIKPFQWYRKVDPFQGTCVGGRVSEWYTTWQIQNHQCTMKMGTYVAEGEYQNGTQIGKWKATYPDGLVLEGEYQNGKRHGKSPTQLDVWWRESIKSAYLIVLEIGMLVSRIWIQNLSLLLVQHWYIGNGFGNTYISNGGPFLL